MTSPSILKNVDFSWPLLSLTAFLDSGIHSFICSHPVAVEAAFAWSLLFFLILPLFSESICLYIIHLKILTANKL
jgi:hypothetical protein